MFACPTRRALLTCTSNAPSTSRRLISTAAATSLRPQPQKPTRRYSSSSSSSSNSNPFGPGNRGLASKTGAFRKRDNRQLDNNSNSNNTRGDNVQTVVPPISAKAGAAQVDVVKGENAAVVEEGKESQQKSTLPFVARTDHLHESDVHVSSFFALHRPVSVSFPVPGHYTSNHFQKLFDPLDPISALELYKSQLDTQAHQQGGRMKKSGKQGSSQEEALSFVKQALSTTREEQESKSEQAASSDSTVHFSNDALSGNYRPFHPPPPPLPISDEPTPATEPEGTTFTTVKVVTRPIQSADGKPAGYMVSFYEAQDKATRAKGRLRVSMRSKLPTMQALSVKRQRKLKMKKHKYKKLMKKTRTLRRKLEKQ